MKKNWKNAGGTYDTDRYEMQYRISQDGEFTKCVWASDTFVGPEAYNRSHIDLILSNMKNSVQNIIDKSNPYYTQRGTLSEQNVKFKP